MQAKTFTQAPVALLVAIVALAPSTAFACGPSGGEIIAILSVFFAGLGVLAAGFCLSVYGSIRAFRRRAARNATVIL